MTKLKRRVDLLMRLQVPVKEASKILGPSKTRIHVIAQQTEDGKRRRRSLSQKRVDRLRNMLEDGDEPDEICRAIRIDKSTLREYELRFLDELGPLHVRPTRDANRCGGCGHLINVKPCVICAGRAEQSANAGKGGGD